MTDLTSLTLSEARDRLRKREFSAAELADAHLAAIEAARSLNAYLLETADLARAMAQLPGDWIVDGEIVAGNCNRPGSFQAL